MATELEMHKLLYALQKLVFCIDYYNLSSKAINVCLSVVLVPNSSETAKLIFNEDSLSSLWGAKDFLLKKVCTQRDVY